MVQQIRDRLLSESAKFDDVDGVRVNTQDGWWLLRASNTQAVLVARAEASDDAGLQRLKASLRRHLESSGVTVPAEILRQVRRSGRVWRKSVDHRVSRVGSAPEATTMSPDCPGHTPDVSVGSGT